MQTSLDHYCGTPFWDTNQTWNTYDPDFTDCFHKTALVWIPCGFLWLFAPLELYWLQQRKRRQRKWSILGCFKLLLTAAMVTLSAINFFYILYQQYEVGKDSAWVEYFTPIIEFTSLVLVVFFLIVSNRQGMFTSPVLFFFWFLLVICNTFTFRSIIKQIGGPKQESTFPFVSNIIFYLACVLQLILSAVADVPSEVKIRHKDEKRSPEETASFLSFITFTWFDRMAWYGFRRPITEADLWTLPTEFQTVNVDRKFDSHLVPGKSNRRRRHTGSEFEYTDVPHVTTLPKQEIVVSRSLWNTFGLTFMGGVVLKIAGDLAGLASPLILQYLIDFVKSEDPQWHGYFFAIMLCLGALLESQLLQRQWDVLMKLSIRVRSALISAIYKKAMRISNASKRSTTVGEIVNLMSVDAQHVSDIVADLPLLFSAPIQLGLAIYMLWNVMGVAVLAGMSVFLIVFPANIILGSKTEKEMLNMMERKDERVKVINEVLSGIKVLKLYAWEMSFFDQISAIRNKEIDINKVIVWINSTIWFMFNCTPFLISVTMFATYIYNDSSHVFDASKAFVALTLLNIMKEPMSFAPSVIAYVIQMRVSLKRLNKFMNSEDVDMNQVTHNDTGGDAVFMEKGNFSWQPDTPPTLKNITFRVPRGAIIAVVGPVGAGKSSLVSAMLGEMEKLSGTANTVGSIAYVPQQAWIQNATLKDNILFKKPLNETVYQNVIEACALQPDLEILPGGDQTEIGEKGINLSGGQKQRVSLARATYNNADLYLLDDPLSAVDSHVGKHLFDKVIGPKGLLKNKTRILVTHGLTFLPEVDSILVLDNGIIAEVGSYQELIDADGKFAELVRVYQTEERAGEEFAGDNVVGSPTSDQGGSRRPSYMRQVSKALSHASVSSDEVSPREGLRRMMSQISSQGVDIYNVPGATLIELETVETGKVGWNVYSYYLRAIGWLSFTVYLFFELFGWGLNTGSNIWLSIWSNDPPGDTSKRDMRLGVYAGLGVGQAIIIFFGYVVAGLSFLRAARILHANMLLSILRSPMSFFDTTPIGRIMNRFSHDVDTVDTTIPQVTIFLVELIFQLISVLVIIIYSTPMIAAVLVPLGVVYFAIQKFYISTSRQLKRIESINRSPVYSHFSESVSGVSTIRAFRLQGEFIADSFSKLDKNHMAVYPNYASRRWLSVRLDLIGNAIVFATAVFAVLNRNKIDAGTLGLAVSYAINVTFVLNWIAKMMSELEAYIVSVERIKEYNETDNEAEWEKLSKKPGDQWPEKGAMSFENYSTRYRDGLDLVLNDINCKVNEGEKVGIVGRTGAGKSSLTLALFRLIEAADGRIKIDNVEIGGLGLHDLRSRLTIIPQDPVLFCGSLRVNLDPFNKYTDSEVWNALEHAHLKEFVTTLPEGLQYSIAEGGDNLSVGQRQLVCLARALLKKTKVLVLDEATAAVDLETDDLIQATIRKEFADCTVLTIAHRLNTIMDSTRVMVLSNGVIQEYDTPSNLLKNRDSVFYSMAKDAGLV